MNRLLKVDVILEPEAAFASWSRSRTSAVGKLVRPRAGIVTGMGPSGEDLCNGGAGGVKIQKLFERYNRKYFRGRLSKYRVIESDKFGSHGMCRPKQREIHIAQGLKGLDRRKTLLHEMAHGASNGGHGKSWHKEMMRLARMGAPTRSDAISYTKSSKIFPVSAMIGQMEDWGLESGNAAHWGNIRRTEHYRNGLVDKNGRAESPGASRLLHKLHLAFLRGVRLRKSMDKAQRDGESGVWK